MLKAFDFDFIVNYSDIPPHEAIRDRYQRQFINQTTKHKSLPKGVDLAYVVQHLWENEIRYITQETNIISPKASKPFEKFSSFVFGRLPSEKTKIKYDDMFAELLKAEEFSVDKESFFEYMLNDYWSPVRLTSYGLTVLRSQGSFSSHIIYVGHHLDLSDLIEYWNLRASGREVLFLPVQFYDVCEKAVIEMVNRGDYPVNPNYQNHADIQKAPSVSKDDFNKVGQWINSISDKSKLPLRPWRAKWEERGDFISADIEPVDIEESSKSHITIIEDKKVLPFELAIPELLDKADLRRGECSWANILSFSGYYENDLVLNIPYGEEYIKTLSQAFLSFLPEEIRVNRQGIVTYRTSRDETETLFPPTVFEVVEGLFDKCGMRIEYSQPGRYTDAIINFVGDLHGDCRIFKVNGVRKLLNNLSRRTALTDDVYQESLEIVEKINAGVPTRKDLDTLTEIISKKLPAKPGQLTHDQIVKQIRDGWTNDYRDLILFRRQKDKLTPEDCFQYLLEKKVISPGMKLKCGNCGADNWYRLGAFSDRFTCSYCFTSQDTPNIEKKDWYYAPNGVFAEPNVGRGGLSTILALWRFNHFSSFSKSKYISSVNVYESKGGRLITELDFVILLGGHVWNDTGVDVIIGEAKTHKDIDHKTFQKLKSVAKRIGRRVHVCIAKDDVSFTQKEKDEMKEMIKKGFSIIPLTRPDLEPYDLFDRFDKLQNKHAVTLEEFRSNLQQLNL